MLAKTLEEVRKNRSMSPSTQQFVSGNVSRPAPECNQTTGLAKAAEEFTHLPIRISCPKVDKQVNVGLQGDNFSESDSAQSILLDQVISEKQQSDRQPEVIIRNNVPNVKVRSVTSNGKTSSNNPVQIIIQVENLPSSGAPVGPEEQRK